MPQKRSAFFISDRTGITAEMLGHSLLTQFEMVSFNEVTLPFVDSIEKADAAVRQINEQGEKDGTRPLIFSTLVNQDCVATSSRQANALVSRLLRYFHPARWKKSSACWLRTPSAAPTAPTISPITIIGSRR